MHIPVVQASSLTMVFIQAYMIFYRSVQTLCHYVGTEDNQLSYEKEQFFHFQNNWAKDGWFVAKIRGKAGCTGPV